LPKVSLFRLSIGYAARQTSCRQRPA